MPVELESIKSSLLAHGVTPERLAMGVVAFAGSIALTLVIGTLVLVRLPVTYFQEASAPRPDRSAWVRFALAIGRNLLGVVLVVLGVIMVLPGVPGQGILTILIGIMLLDVPGKRRLERRIVSNPRILAAINRLRGRFGREPLLL